MAWVFGYFRASWTLRVDIIGDFISRLLKQMHDTGATMVMPTLRPEDAGMALRPWVDPADFNPGYIQRGLHLLPRQGDRMPWLHTQDFPRDRTELPNADLNDGALIFK
jgi:hypothetical protein